MLNNKKILYKLIKLLFKKGKKQKAETIVKKMLFEINERGYAANEVLAVGFSTLQPFFKIRNTRIRGTFFIVPLPRTVEQRFFFALKFLIEEAKLDKKRFAVVLAEELLKLYRGNYSSPAAKIDELNISAVKNRTFSFYRWF